MKKKFQITALKIAAITTGVISNNMAKIETASNKMSAIT